MRARSMHPRRGGGYGDFINACELQDFQKSRLSSKTFTTILKVLQDFQKPRRQDFQSGRGGGYGDFDCKNPSSKETPARPSKRRLRRLWRRWWR